MARTIYIDVALEKKKVIQQMKDLEKDLKASIKRAEKNAKIKINLDEKGLKNSAKRASSEASKTIKSISNSKVKMVLNEADFKSQLDRIQLTARDTGKQLDKSLLTKLEVDYADLEIAKKQAQEYQKQAKILFEKWIIPKEKYREAIRQTKALSSATTEANRRLQNYRNTWEKNISRLQAKFNDLKNSISGAVKATLWFLWVTFVFQKIGQAINFSEKTFRSYESAFAGFRKTLEATELELKEIEKGIVNMSKRVPKSAEDLSRIAEVAWQMGIASEDILNFTEVTAMLSTAIDGIEADNAVKIMSRLQDQAWEATSELLNQANALVFLWNNYKANEWQILSFANYIKSLWSVLDFSSADLLAFSTVFVDAWISAEAWGTQVTKAWIVIETAVKNSADSLWLFWEISWRTKEQFVKDWGDDSAKVFADILVWIWNSWDLAIPVMQELFWKNVRTANAFLSVAWNAHKLEKALDDTREAYENGTYAIDEFQKRLATNDSQIILNQNRWKAWSLSFGKDISSAKLAYSSFFLEAIPRGYESAQIFFTTMIASSRILWIQLKNMWEVAYSVFYNFWKNASILVWNIWSSFENGLPNAIKIGVNGGIKVLEKFINYVGKNVVNQLAKIPWFWKLKWLWKISLDGIKFDVTEWSKARDYIKIGEEIDKITEKNKRLIDIENDAYNASRERLKEQRKTAEANKEAIEKTNNQIRDEINKEISDQEEKIKKLQELLTWGDTSWWEALWENAEDSINAINDKIQELTKELNNASIWSDSFKKLQGEISKYQKMLEEVSKTDKEREVEKIKKLEEDQEKLFENNMKRIEEVGENELSYWEDLLAQYKGKLQAIDLLSEMENEHLDDSEKLLEIDKKREEYRKDMYKISKEIFQEEKKSLEELGKSIEKLQEEAQKITKDKDDSLADRKIDIGKEKTDIQEELVKWEFTGRVWNTAERIRDIDEELKWEMSEQNRIKLEEKRGELMDTFIFRLKESNFLTQEAYELRKELLAEKILRKKKQS